MFNTIFSMYQNIKSSLSYNGQTCEPFACEIGVRQGENLSPFLFSLYLNDLEDYLISENVLGMNTISKDIEEKLGTLMKLFIILYADDTVIMAESPDQLQHALNKFKKYCETWKMRVNIDKTKILIFSKRRTTNPQLFRFNNHLIETVKHFNYLGIIFSKTGSFKQCKQNLKDKATSAMYEVLRKGRIHNLSIKCHVDLFDLLVKPILLYGCEIWGYENLDILERVQTKFFKLLLHLKPSTQNDFIYGELGLYPLEIDIKTRIISYWTKLITGKESKLAAVMFRYLFKLAQETTFRSRSLDKMKSILDNCGFSYLWSFQNTSPNIKSIIKQRLEDQFTQSWSGKVNDSPKALNYRLYKTSHNFEHYLNVLDDKDVITMSRFRTMNHKLPIENGRWQNIPREQRKCPLCRVAIGDEYHYVMECSSLLTDRTLLIDKKYLTNLNVLKFNAIMNQKQKSKLRKLCQFIRIINEKLDSL